MLDWKSSLSMKTYLPPFRPLRSIQLLSAIVLLWGLADAIISFYIPIQIQTYVQDLTLFGFLLAFSSLVGAFSDPIIGFLSNRVRYVVLLLAGLLLSTVLAMSALLPFSIILILWLMAIWGIYYECINVAIFSYVSRHQAASGQAKSFGVIYLFVNVAYVIGPIIGGYVFAHGGRTIYGLCLLFIAGALALIPQLAALHKHKEKILLDYQPQPKYSLRKQFKSFRKVWRYAAVFFVAIFLFNVWDAFVWDLVPIQSIGGSAVDAGLITAVFTIPLAVLSGYGGAIADKFGRNVTFLAGLLVASFFTLLFGLQTNTAGALVTAGLSSLGFAFAYPAMMGRTTDEGQDHQSEIGNLAAVQRLFVNGGFILGPIIGGYVAQMVGVRHAFTILGAAMLVIFVLIAGNMVHFHIRGRIHRSIEAELDL